MSDYSALRSRTEGLAGTLSASSQSSYIVAGEIGIQAAPGVLRTVLGSCVAVCLWCDAGRVGGLNHYLFPRASAEDSSLLRGDVAIPALIGRMIAAGARPTSMVAKVVGGATSGRHRWHVGSQNILVAWTALRDARVRIVGSDVGGQRGRQLDFDVATGAVQVRYLASLVSSGVEGTR